MTYLRPHTEEWFRALQMAEPIEAALVAQMIRWVGREQICSVCGAEDTRDYKVIARLFAPDVGATMRLCDHCREVRRRYGESFAAL